MSNSCVKLWVAVLELADDGKNYNDSKGATWGYPSLY